MTNIEFTKPYSHQKKSTKMSHLNTQICLEKEKQEALYSYLCKNKQLCANI